MTKAIARTQLLTGYERMLRFQPDVALHRKVLAIAKVAAVAISLHLIYSVLKKMSSATETKLLTPPWARGEKPKCKEKEKLRRHLSEGYAPEDPKFDLIVKSAFPGAISNKELETKMVDVLAEKGFHDNNTLLATSLCCDELARRLEDDLGRVYGNNFTLGGLAGFPFAGVTGFGAMVSHVPDNGFCLIVHGPHVGITKDGTIGKVERKNLALVDNCCGSAIAAARYLRGITDGGAVITAKIQNFLDFQQSAVQEMILPHGKRLHDAGDDFLKEIPYALYQSQDVLLHDIVKQVRNGLKHYRGTAILGGVQINTGPDTMDYFHPLRFELMDNNGNIIEDMLPHLTGEKSENEDDVWASVRNVKISE